MKKKKIFATVIWLIALVALFGLWNFAQNLIDQHFAQVAAKQVVDDSTYGTLKFRQAIEAILKIVAGLFSLLIIWQIINIWWSDNKKVAAVKESE